MNRLLRGAVVQATVHTSGILALRLLAQAGTLLLVARLLGPSDYGTFAGLSALAVVVGAFGTFGMHLVLLKEVSCSPQKRNSIISYALATTVANGMVLLLAYLALGQFLLHGFGIGIIPVVSLAIAETLLQPLLQLASAEHQARGNIPLSQALLGLPLALRFAAIACIWLWHPWPVLPSYSAAYLLATTIALVVAIRSLPESWPRPRSWRLPSRANLSHASGFAFLNLTALGPSELDKTIAIRLLPLGAAGVYAAGTRVTGAMVLPVIALMLSALPRLFRGAASGKDTGLLRWIFGASLTYGSVAAAGVWFCAPGISWMFGNGYEALTVVMKWLALALPAMALRVAAGSALMARGGAWNRAGFELLGLIVLVVAAGPAVSANPRAGMPLALACSEWSMAIVGWLILALNPWPQDRQQAE
ncbi:lipopolysaccharide biosynthesis protein [Fulvimonas yonginensis]|uniref:Lipopolysaccharide biosynthesis protein n=1 Tax=Fulvimonas yonginensis TaxID=1495200 RepID=A0ABU8J9G1_9GAMM